MPPARRKAPSRAAAAAAARQQWSVGDLVLAKMKGFPAWPATVTEPEKWGYSSDRTDRKKLLVYFYGTKQIAFCNFADVEAFTEEKRKYLITKRQGKGADFVRAVDEIVAIYEKLKNQQHTKSNSGEEQTVSSAGNSEVPKNNIGNKSPELTSAISHCHLSEPVVLTERHGVVSPEEIPATSMEVDLQEAAREVNGPSGTICNIDQLRQHPIANTTNLRKNLRDSSLKSFATQKRMTSIRRCRRSSGHNLDETSKSAMLISGSNSNGGDLAPDSVHEGSIPKEEENVEKPHVACPSNPVGPGSTLPDDGTSEEILVEAPLKSEVINLGVGSMLVSGCKAEYAVNGYSAVDKPNGDFTVSEKPEIVAKTVVLKKRRKQNRKRILCDTECANNTIQKTEGQMGENLLELPITPNDTNERSHNADGDEHLPLVKRARCRMSKLPPEETEPKEIVCVEEKSETPLLTTKSDKYVASPCSEDTCSDSKISSSIKETPASLTPNNSTLNSEKSLMFAKATKYELKGTSLDAEAALPPSKRLHRALEAMSANTAEATGDCVEVPEAMELVPNDSVNSPKKSRHQISIDRSAEILEKSDGAIQSAVRLLSSLSPDNVEVHTITSSELKPDASLTGNFRDPSNKDCSSASMDVKACDRSSYSNSDKDSLDRDLQHCSEDIIEKQEGSLSVQSMSNELPSSEVMLNLSSTLGEESSNQKMPPANKILDSQVNSFRRDVTMTSSVQNGSVSNTDNFPSPSIPTTVISERTTGFVTSNSSGVTKFPNTNNIQDAAKEFNTDRIPKDQGVFLDSTPMKNLIAAAQAKRSEARSTSFSDIGFDAKSINDSVSSSLLTKDDFYGQGTPQKSTSRINATEGSTSHLQNGNKISNGGLHRKCLDSHAEANAARKNFQEKLRTLSRARDSIGQATRCAIDCAKHGYAGEVIDIILHNLEREPSLPKRVDLFFLVDSVTRYSRSQKGGAGDVFPSLVQSVLPRLLSAAAPAGNSACENRKQCLKVLRVWLENRSLPESIVRHHMRELEYANEVPYTSSYTRRPSRTERAMDDPVREMEGMLVDEYGSNTSFQIPNFLQPRMFEAEEGSSDDEKSFEAVTPESNIEVDDDKGATEVCTEKHRHVLEDVDGELEMEDLAPPSCVVEMSSTFHVSGGVGYAPPLPEAKPPSPPPLPSSPPPFPLSASHHSNPSGSRPAILASGINNHMPIVNGHLPPNKSYHLPPPPPPPPTVSNHFSYVQAEPQQSQQSWGNSSSLSDNFQYVRNNQRGSYYGDRGYEVSERSRFSPAVHSEPSTRWPLPSRPSSYPPPPSTSSLQGPVPRVPGAAPGYWRPR